VLVGWWDGEEAASPKIGDYWRGLILGIGHVRVDFVGIVCIVPWSGRGVGKRVRERERGEVWTRGRS